MFTLIGIGVSAAYFYSTLALFFPGWIPSDFKQDGHVDVYFEAAAMIVVLVLLGQVLELQARKRTGSAIRELMSLTPPTARLVSGDEIKQVALSQVKVDDVLQVLPGDKVPVDGEIATGSSYVDQSMVTGEPMPIERRPGDMVFGGTLNQAGTFRMRAQRVGQQTLLSQIVNLVAEAQRSCAPIQRVADRVAGWFVPVVLLAAVVTFVLWAIFSPWEPRLAYALINAVAVLIIACPCALGLATPMSIMVGIGRGAREGILIKDAAVLEVLENVNTLVLDKTGTLTAGKPQLTQVMIDEDPSREQIDESDLLSSVAAVEQNSEHPLAFAILDAVRQRGLNVPGVDQFAMEAGSGVQGRVGEQTFLIGKAEYLRAHGVEDLQPWIVRARRFRTQEARSCSSLEVSDWPACWRSTIQYGNRRRRRSGSCTIWD